MVRIKIDISLLVERNTLIVSTDRNREHPIIYRFRGARRICGYRRTESAKRATLVKCTDLLKIRA